MSETTSKEIRDVRIGATMLVFVILDDRAGQQEQKKVYVFDNHDDALRCRRELKLDSHHLWGTTIGCYDFKLPETRTS